MATTYLSKTLGTPTNTKIWTFSAWCKRSIPDATGTLISSGSSTTDTISMASNGKLNYYVAAGNSGQLTTNRLFQDVSGWYHIVVAVDTTQSTASNRIKIYVNGVQETSFSTETYPSQNFDTKMNSAILHTIGGYSEGSSGEFWNGLMTQVILVDGLQLTPSTFGSINSTSGIWVGNTSPTVTYGNNGFNLDMANSSDMGNDVSGNANDFTVIAGTLIQIKDCPDNVFSTLNPLYVINAGQMPTLTNGNTTGTSTSSGYNSGVASIAPSSSGKYYSEHKLISGTGGWETNTLVGYSPTPDLIPNAPHDSNFYYGVLADGDAKQGATSRTGYAGTWTAGDIIQLALDLDNNKLYVGKNGLWADGSGNWDEANINAFLDLTASPAVAGDNWFVICGDKNTSTATWGNNFGNGYFGTTAVSSAGTNASAIGIFEYDVPTGFTALSTKGLNL